MRDGCTAYFGVGVLELEQAKELAGTCLRLMLVPVLATSEVSKAAGVQENTIRQWIKRGQVELRNSERPGPGKVMLFSSADMLEVMAFAEISRLGLPLNTFAAAVAEVIRSAALKKIDELAGEWGPWKPEWQDDMRFVVIFHKPWDGEHEWSQSSVPRLHPPNPLVAAWVVIDCFALALRALETLGSLKKKGKGASDE